MSTDLVTFVLVCVHGKKYHSTMKSLKKLHDKRPLHAESDENPND